MEIRHVGTVVLSIGGLEQGGEMLEMPEMPEVPEMPEMPEMPAGMTAFDRL